MIRGLRPKGSGLKATVSPTVYAVAAAPSPKNLRNSPFLRSSFALRGRSGFFSYKNKSFASLHLFNKYLNNNYKIMPFNLQIVNLGATKYYPPVSNEWKNSIYIFNRNNLNNLPLYDNIINNFINRFFKLRLYYKNINKRHRSYRRRRRTMNKIYVNLAEIKHTNSKANLTIYSYNREKISLLKKLNGFKLNTYRLAYSIIKLLKTKKIWGVTLFKNVEGGNHLKAKAKAKVADCYAEDKPSDNLKPQTKLIKALFYKKLLKFKSYKLRLYLNESKFQEQLLYVLSSFISKYYNKKVIFNLVNLKSFILNSDLFTKILTLRVRYPKKINLPRLMRFIINKAKITKLRKVIERSQAIKTVDLKLFENRYKNIYLNSIINNQDLDPFPSLSLLERSERSASEPSGQKKNKNQDGVILELPRYGDDGDDDDDEDELAEYRPVLEVTPSSPPSEGLNAVVKPGDVISSSGPYYNLDALLKDGYNNNVYDTGQNKVAALTSSFALSAPSKYVEGGGKFRRKSAINAGAGANAAPDINSYKKDDNFAINDIIFNSIKYKDIGGVRLEIRGRLTKRYRADRSIYKLRWKGGLRNIDASLKKVSIVNKRGNINPNVEYSIYTSKRRIGAFAIKGWISGK